MCADFSNAQSLAYVWTFLPDAIWRHAAGPTSAFRNLNLRTYDSCCHMLASFKQRNLETYSCSYKQASKADMRWLL